MKRYIILLQLIWLSISGWAWHGKVAIENQKMTILLIAEEGQTLHCNFIYEGDTINGIAIPTFGTDNPTTPIALQIGYSNGDQNTELAVSNYRCEQQERSTTHIFTLSDKLRHSQVDIFYKTYHHSDIVETWTLIKNNGTEPITLNRFDSACLPLPEGEAWLIQLNGTWANEGNITEERLTNGIKTIFNTDGARNAQTSEPSIMLTFGNKPSEHNGLTIGATLCWSGNYELRLHSIDNKYHTLFAGINPLASHYVLRAGEQITTPSLAFTISNEGKGGVSRAFHLWAREEKKIYRGWKTGDILLNSWEGVYFDITEKKIIEMITDISNMGGELIVMDDGWFGNDYQRTNDAALGDWEVDKKKLPNGLSALIRAAHKRGIGFGIWIEPEAINTKSRLYQQHPEWVLQSRNSKTNYGRGGTQLLLDLTNPEVRQFIIDVITRLLTRYPDIAYIKWDANVSLLNYGSIYLPTEKQSNLYVDYHLGLVQVLKTIRERFPNVIIQDCASGGGRANYGLLPFFDEYWLSDNNDALQRLKIQYGASLFFPANAMATHIGSSPDHTTGRKLPIKFRTDVAMNGRMGLELQPKTMTKEEKQQVKRSIRDYKQLRETIQTGELYRLITPYDGQNIISTMYVGKGGNAVLLVYKTSDDEETLSVRLPLSGLIAERSYTFEEKNVNIKNSQSLLDGTTISGANLMEEGVDILLEGSYDSKVYLLK